MAAIVQVQATALLNAAFLKVTYVPPATPLMVALTTTIGTNTAAGTEVTGGSYARQSLTAALGSNAASGSITTTVAVTFTNMPAVGSPGVQALEVWDSTGSPVREWFGALTLAKITNSGDTLSFAIGAITATLG